MRKKLLYICLSVLILMTGGCSSDDSGNEIPAPSPNEKVAVHLRIAPAGSSKGMRAWTDDNATDDEMMNIWVVVITDEDDAVETVLACKPTADSREIDPIALLPMGVHHFYSFANMSVASIASTLGITVTMPEMTDADEVYEATTASGTVVADKNVMVNGNKFSLFNPSDNNGFGSYGIPMSNVQSATITGSTTLDLIVIRMLAKIELQFYNDTGSDVTVTGITLTDVTANAANNLKLLPSLTAGANIMDPVHGDIQPHLNGTPATGNVTYTEQTIAVSAETNNPGGTPVKFTFYVNESAAPAVTASNVFGHYFLTVTLDGETEARYALIDDTNADPLDEGRWDYIARNDYRIIPIVLDDYKLDIIPYDFPAIGIYPASVKEEDGYYTINFHDYGHFHLVPKVTKISTSVVVPFAATAPTGTYASTSWGLVNDTFTDSWGSWTDVTKATEYVNEEATTPFYRTGYTTDPPVDGDEVGGEPVWYPNTSAPQWDPAGGSTYNPFIFGYIADPGAALAADRKVYHEFSVNLYKQGMTAPRVMTYRLYMILDTDQMMYSRRFGAPRVRHTHNMQ